MRTAIIVVSLGVALLMWLALDDTTTGREPSHALEWTMVTLGPLWLICLAVARVRWA